MLGSHPATFQLTCTLRIPSYAFRYSSAYNFIIRKYGCDNETFITLPRRQPNKKKIPLLKSKFCGAFLAGSDVHLLASNFPAGLLTHPWMGLPDDMPYGLALANVLQRDYIMKKGRIKKEFQTTRPSINRSTRIKKNNSITRRST